MHMQIERGIASGLLWIANGTIKLAWVFLPGLLGMFRYSTLQDKIVRGGNIWIELYNKIYNVFGLYEGYIFLFIIQEPALDN